MLLLKRRRFDRWRESGVMKVVHQAVKNEDSENIEDDDSLIEEDKKSVVGNKSVMSQNIDVDIFEEEIKRGETQLSQMLKQQQLSNYPAQKMREEALKKKIKEICMAMMSDIIAKYSSFKKSHNPNNTTNI